MVPDVPKFFRAGEVKARGPVTACALDLLTPTPTSDRRTQLLSSTTTKPSCDRFSGVLPHPPTMSQAAAAARLLEAQFNHLVLPARVPSKRDDNLADIEAALTDRLLEATRILRDSTDSDGYLDWDSVRRILLTVKDLNLGGKLDKLGLGLEFHRLDYGSPLILHVAEQNAGVLVRRFQR